MIRITFLVLLVLIEFEGSQAVDIQAIASRKGYMMFPGKNCPGTADLHAGKSTLEHCLDQCRLHTDCAAAVWNVKKSECFEWKSICEEEVQVTNPSDYFFEKKILKDINDTAVRFIIKSGMGKKESEQSDCLLSDFPSLRVEKDKLKNGQKFDTGDCATLHCHVDEYSGTFDLYLDFNRYGCWKEDHCADVNAKWRDERCFERTCRVSRSKADGMIRSDVGFVSQAPHCKAADGACMTPGSKHFDCYLYDEFNSHCRCRKKGKIVFLAGMMRFGQVIPTEGGNAAGKHCFFPFKANRLSHTECIDSGKGRPWCGTTSDYDKDQKWGYCISDPPSYRFTETDNKCHLPFKYNGVLYHDCTKVNSNSGKPWCYLDFLGARGWEYCEQE